MQGVKGFSKRSRTSVKKRLVDGCVTCRSDTPANASIATVGHRSATFAKRL